MIRPTRSWRHAAAALAAAVFLAGAPAETPVAAAGEKPPPRLPFSDDLPPPPPLPEPLDRRFHGKLTSFDGERVGYRWTWTSDAELEDFEPFVPVRVTVRGAFERKAAADGAKEDAPGTLVATGTAGIRLRLGMLADLMLTTTAVLEDPHDLGVVLAVPGTSDESLLCLVQDRVFTRFDAAAGNTNMINKIGGIPSTGGMVEFRYVDRKPQPKLARGAQVRFDVLRKGPHTTFTITPKGDSPTVLQGKDTDTPMTRFQAGLYVAGAACEFGPLEIEGKIDPAWCQENAVLPFVANDLLHPGNRFQGAVRKAAETVETFAKQAASETPPDPKVAVLPDTVAAMIGDAKLPLVIRMRAAEALAETGAPGEAAALSPNSARLLDAAELETRVLAWRILRPRLPWHFRYEPDADPAVRKEASLLVGDYLRREADETAMGKVFVEGEWTTPSRADQIRAAWPKSWDLRGPHVRLRTNLSREWADWTYDGLESAYRELVRLLGREPPKEQLPLSVLLFARNGDFQAFCEANGYAEKATWRRFADLDRLVALDTFERDNAPQWQLHLLAKLFLRSGTGRFWPSWFEEGRAAWFAHGELGTGTWDGTTLRTGLPAKGVKVTYVSAGATQGKLWTTSDFLAKDPRSLDGEDRVRWYAHAWALHAYLMDAAEDDDRRRFAAWQSAIETLAPSPREVEAAGRKQFLGLWGTELEAFDARFREWAKRL